MAAWVAAFSVLLQAHAFSFHETIHAAQKYSEQGSAVPHLDQERCLICDSLQIVPTAPQIITHFAHVPLIERKQQSLVAIAAACDPVRPFGARAPPA